MSRNKIHVDDWESQLKAMQPKKPPSTIAREPTLVPVRNIGMDLQGEGDRARTPKRSKSGKNKNPTIRRPSNDPVFRTLLETKESELSDARKRQIVEYNQSRLGWRPKQEVPPSPPPPPPVDDAVLTENNLLKIEMDDLVSQLELVKSENDGLAQRLNDARKNKERMDRAAMDEMRELRDKIREFESLNHRMMQQMDNRGREYESENRILQQEIDKLMVELERKSNAVDQAQAENERQRATMVPIARERKLQQEIQSLTSKADQDFRSLQRAHQEIEALKRDRVPIEREEELKTKLEKMIVITKGKDRTIDELTKERDDLVSTVSDVRRKNEEMKNRMLELEKINRALTERKDSVDDEVLMLRAQADSIKAEKEERDEERIRIAMKLTALEERSKGVVEIIRPLQELIREQESHIVDLQKELDTQRQVMSNYHREMGTLRTIISDEELARGKLYDVTGAHRRLLNENARLIDLLEQHQLAETKVKTDHSRVKQHLDQTSRKLKTSSDRIAQLEDWLDEIYNDKNFDVILKNRSTRHPYLKNSTNHKRADNNLPLVPVTNYRTLAENRRKLTAKHRPLRPSGYLSDRL